MYRRNGIFLVQTVLRFEKKKPTFTLWQPSCIITSMRYYSEVERPEQIKTHHTLTKQPAELTTSDIGKYYSVPMETFNLLNFNKTLTLRYIKQVQSFDECCWLCREQLIETINCLKSVGSNVPALRLVLWGPFGTGKSLTLQQIIHYGHTQNYVIVAHNSLMQWTRQLRELQSSSYKNDRIDTPFHAEKFLQYFKQINQLMWPVLSKLKVERTYTWSKVESTQQGKPLTDIVEMGLYAPYLASDCVGALCRELRHHASLGEIRLLVALDQANSLYGNKTVVRKADKTYAKPHELTLVHNFRKFFRNDWSNGACVLVADKTELSDARDRLTIPLNTPLELFGEEGFSAIDPFIPIETKLYTIEEMNAVYNYFVEKNWLTSEKARTEEGRKQLAYISAFNPHYYDKLCAFN